MDGNQDADDMMQAFLDEKRFAHKTTDPRRANPPPELATSIRC
jgi:hypothetical protein